MAFRSWVRLDRSHSLRGPDGDARGRPPQDPGGAVVRAVLQPIVDLASGAVVGAEALARFADSSDLPVGQRFAQAHAAGHGAELEAACLRAALRRRADLPGRAWLAVNVSPNALGHPDVQHTLAGDLAGVVIEVTEDAASDPTLVLGLLARLRERGALIAVDDASTGYAGLLRLSTMRPDIVKLDAALVTGAADSVEQSAVIEALVSLSRRIGARVIGEGVETIDDLRALVDLDVDYAQGFIVGLPAEVLASASTAAIAACLSTRRTLMRRQPSAPDAVLNLHQVTAALAASVDAEDLNASLLRASTSLAVDTIGLSVLAGGQLREIATADTTVDQAAYPLTAYPATRAALTSGKIIEIHLDDPHSDTAERTLLHSHGFASLLLVPLTRQGAPLGILEFFHRTPRRWTSHDLRQAHILADHVTHALQRLTAASDNPANRGSDVLG
jgi:EAL domain-containing protein (putative c-di-GMP-specific phosphodiesterase class I)